MKDIEKEGMHLEKLNFDESTKHMDKHYSDSKFLSKLKRLARNSQKRLYMQVLCSFTHLIVRSCQAVLD